MNSENVLRKEIVKSFIDLANVAKGLMDENQQPSVQQELEFSKDCSPVIEVERGEVKAENFAGLAQMNHLLLQQLIKILLLQHRLPQNGRLQKYGDQKLVVTPSKFADLLLGSCQFSGLVLRNCRLKFSEEKQKLRYFEPFQSRSKGI